MGKAGFGPAFKHGLGHGFGFQAINHTAAPVLHPASDAVLRSGMMHNMEPGSTWRGKEAFASMIMSLFAMTETRCYRR